MSIADSQPDTGTDLEQQVRELQIRVQKLEQMIMEDHERLEHDHEVLERLDSSREHAGSYSPVGL